MSTTLETTVVQKDVGVFEAATPSGHLVRVDHERGPRPMELLLVALGACTGADVTGILRSLNQEVTEYAVHVQGERRDDYPRRFVSIRIEHDIRGRNLNDESVRRAIELSTGKCCSVGASLGGTVEIVDYYVAVDETTGRRFAGTHRAMPLD